MSFSKKIQKQSLIKSLFMLKKIETHFFQNLINLRKLKMEYSNHFSFINTLVFLAASLLLYSLLTITYVVWWRPKSLEKYFRQQGIKGTSYKLFHGDTKEMVRSSMEAWSKPISLNHNIVPRALPFVDQMVENYGRLRFFFF